MALKSYIGRTNVSPASLSNLSGITRGAQAASQALLGGISVAKTVGDVAYKEGAAMREKEGLAAGAEAEIIKTDKGYQLPEDVGGTFSVYDQAYTKSTLAKYQAKIHNDINETLNTYAQENYVDEANFNAVAGGHIKGLMEGVDPRVRNEVTAYAYNLKNQLSNGIGNRVARISYNNGDKATTEAVSLAASKGLNAATVAAKEGVDTLDHPLVVESIREFSQLLDARVQAAYINEEQARNQYNAFVRQVTIQSSLTSFVNMNETQRIEALEDIRTRGTKETKFWKDNIALGDMSEAQLNGAYQLFSALNTSENNLRTATERAQTELLMENYVRMASDFVSPQTLKAFKQVTQSGEFKATIAGPFLTKLQTIINKKEAQIEKNRLIAENKNIAEASYNALLGLMPPETITQWNVLTNSLGLDPYAKDKRSVARLLSNFVKLSEQARSAKSTAQRKQLNSQLVNILIKENTDENMAQVLKQFQESGIDLTDPENSDNLLHVFSKMNNYYQAKETKDRLERERLARDGDYNSAIEMGLEDLERIDPARYRKVIAALEDTSRPFNQKDVGPQFRYRFLLQNLKQSQSTNSAVAKENSLKLIMGRIRALQPELRDAAFKEVALANKNLPDPTVQVTQIRSIASRYEAIAKSIAAQSEKDRPLYLSLRGGVPVSGKPDSEQVQRIGTDLIQLASSKKEQANGADITGSRVNTGSLDPTDPRTWSSVVTDSGTINLYNMGIPESQLSILRGIAASGDVEINGQMVSAQERQAKATQLFKYLRNDPAASVHLKSQLGAEIYGHLNALSSFGLNSDLFKQVLNDRRKGNKSARQENKSILPSSFKALDKNNNPKSDSLILQEFRDYFADTSHAKLVQGDDGYWKYIGESISLSSGIGAAAPTQKTRTISSPPAVFIEDVYNVTMSTLHYYDGTPEEKLDQAIDAAVHHVMSDSGPNAWRLSKAMGRQPGISNRGQYTLVKNAPEAYYSVSPTPSDPTGTKWIYPAIEKSIVNQLPASLKERHRITFGETGGSVFLIPIQRQSDDQKPLYNVGVYGANGEIVTHTAVKEDGSPVVVDISGSYETKRYEAVQENAQAAVLQQQQHELEEITYQRRRAERQQRTAGRSPLSQTFEIGPEELQRIRKPRTESDISQRQFDITPLEL